MAKTLGQVMRAVAKELNTTVSVNEEFQIYTLLVSYADDRSQAISATIDDDDQGVTWLTVRSGFGKLEDLDAQALLVRNNDRQGHGFIAVDDEGDAHVMGRLPLANVDEVMLREMVYSIAAYADVLEDEFYGTDDK